jgi:hypothetical protein
VETKRNEETLKERERSIVSMRRLHDKGKMKSLIVCVQLTICHAVIKHFGMCFLGLVTAKEQDRMISQLEKECADAKERYFPAFPS